MSAPSPPKDAFTEYKPGIRAWLLNKWAAENALSDFKTSEQYGSIADNLFKKMAQRNARGEQLERSGALNNAITLYEQNVADWFDGSFPYERLRIIYTKQRRYDEAIRVCEAYNAMAEQKHSLDTFYLGDGQFSAWIEKLKAKREGRPSGQKELNDVLKRWGW